MRTNGFMMIVLASFLVGFGMPVRAAEEEGAPVPPDSTVKADAVHGLQVDFYDFMPKDAAGIDSMDIAKDYISKHKPDVTYILNVRSVDFPKGPEGCAPPDTLLGDFLLGKEEFAVRKKLAEEKKGDPVPERFDRPIGNRTIYVLTGFIGVSKPGSYKVIVPVDDADELSIGGVVVQNRGPYGAMLGLDAPESIGHMTFAKAGIYPVKIIFYDREGLQGIEVFSDVDPRGEVHTNGKVLLPFLTSKKK